MAGGLGSSGFFFHKISNPIHEGLTLMSWPSHLPEAPSPNAIILGARFQHRNLMGEDKIHTTVPSICLKCKRGTFKFYIVKPYIHVWLKNMRKRTSITKFRIVITWSGMMEVCLGKGTCGCVLSHVWPRDRTCVSCGSCIGGRTLSHWAIWEAHLWVRECLRYWQCSLW